MSTNKLLNYVSVNLRFLVAALRALRDSTVSKRTRFFTELPSFPQRQLVPGLQFSQRC